MEDLCRHTGGTDTVPGIVDIAGNDAFVGSILCKTWSACYRVKECYKKHKKQRK